MLGDCTNYYILYPCLTFRVSAAVPLNSCLNRHDPKTHDPIHGANTFLAGTEEKGQTTPAPGRGLFFCPMSHRAKPFTGKQKKLQLQEKRARKRNEGLGLAAERSTPIVVGTDGSCFFHG